MAKRDKAKDVKSPLPYETGTWVSGITNREILELFGTIMANWVHVEEAMRHAALRPQSPE
jgi:hypothetical protein